MSILACYSLSFTIYFAYFLSSPHRNLQMAGPTLPIILTKVYFVYISYVRILALQFTPIAPQFSSPGIAEIGKGST